MRRATECTPRCPCNPFPAFASQAGRVALTQGTSVCRDERPEKNGMRAFVVVFPTQIITPGKHGRTETLKRAHNWIG